MSPEGINDLLAVARIRPELLDRARFNLEGWLTPTASGKSPAKSIFDAGAHKGTAGPHNAALDQIRTCVTDLIEALNGLRELPHVHDVFWYSDHFGPVFDNEKERPWVRAGLEKILLSAVDAKRRGTREKDQGRYNLVCWSTNFFNRFSTEPTKSPTKTSFGSLCRPSLRK